MIGEVNLCRTASIKTNSKNSINKNVNFGNTQCDKVDINYFRNKKRAVAKKSVIAGVIAGLATLGLAIFSKKARANLMLHEFIEIPLLVGSATTLFANFIGNHIPSKKYNDNYIYKNN